MTHYLHEHTDNIKRIKPLQGYEEHWNMLIKKRKEYIGSVALLWIERPPKRSTQVKRELAREAAKRPRVTMVTVKMMLPSLCFTVLPMIGSL